MMIAIAVSVVIVGVAWFVVRRNPRMSEPSDVEQLRAVIEDRGGEIQTLRQATGEAESRMAKMFALRDPAKVRDAAEALAEKIGDVFAGSYATTAERRARIAQIAVDLIVRTAIGESAEWTIESALKDAAERKAAAEKSIITQTRLRGQSERRESQIRPA
jgi:hypothetical protein